MQEHRDHEPTFMHVVDDFILPVTTRSASYTALNSERSTHASSTDAAVYGIPNNHGVNSSSAPSHQDFASGDSRHIMSNPLAVPYLPRQASAKYLLSLSGDF